MSSSQQTRELEVILYCHVIKYYCYLEHVPASTKSKLYISQLLVILMVLYNYVHAAKVFDVLKPANKRARGNFVLPHN